MSVIIIIAVIAAIIGITIAAGYGVRIMKEYERAVIFRLGRAIKAKGPGPIIIWPGMDKYVTVSLRTVTFDVPPQDIITKDNITVKVNAVVYFRIVDPVKAINQVENYEYATSQAAQTTLRSILGQNQLDDLLAKRDTLNMQLQKIIDAQTEPWGVKVTSVEVKNIDIPQGMLTAIAKQAEAEREKRAKIIHAQGELESSEMLTQAAQKLASEPTSMQLRYLGTLAEIATEKSSIIVFPVPVDVISQFLKK